MPKSSNAARRRTLSAIEADLRDRLASNDAVVVVGAGVSVAATSAAPVAGWRGLLEHGVDRCLEVAALDAGWARRVREEINSGDVDDLLSAAEKVTQKLGGRESGEYKRWLRDTVGRLEASAARIIQAVVGLGAPILTTNYDTLLEQVSGFESVTWRSGVDRVQRLLTGEEPGVLHLHGSWREPESVVLGIRSYDVILANEMAQASQQALAMMKSFVFIGFGEGLADPNFEALRSWMKRVLGGAERRHFRLVLDRDVQTLQREHTAEQVRVISYGSRYEDLEAYLRSLAPTHPIDETVNASPTHVVDYSELILGGVAQRKTEVFAVAVSPLGNLIAAGTDGEILLWSTDQLTGGVDASRERIHPQRLREPASYVYSVAFSPPDGALLASGEQARAVRVWDLRTRKQLWENSSQHKDAVYSVAFSADGKRLVTGGYDGRVILWNALSGTWLPSPDPISRVTSVAFSPNGQQVAIGYLDNGIRLWDVHGTRLTSLGQHASSVETVAFSPDGRFVASSGLDKVIKLWDVESRTEVWSETTDAGHGHEYLVRCVAFAPDGRTIASASWDKTVRLWRVEDGSCYLSMPFREGLPWHDDWIWSVAFSNLNGMILATGGSDGLTLWRVEESGSL